MKAREPVAIIDIGSNSVRLVVYSGQQRVPAPIFNEKVMAGLGAGLAGGSRLTAESQESAIEALRRYHLLLRHMKVKRVRTIATAAVRDADNGAAFVRRIDRIGFDCEVLSPEDEARLAGEGVLSAVPGADGIVGDLGGGSLELVDVRRGSAGNGISLPLGVLRVGPGDEASALAILRPALESSGLAGQSPGRPFYMVGGSWRALSRIHMIVADFPLPIRHQYAIDPAEVGALRSALEDPDPRWKKAVAQARLETSPVAAMLLDCLCRELRPSELVLSSFGIREGLLYSMLGKAARALDPLIEGARDAGGADGRFGEHGDVLDGWIGAIFDDDTSMRRLRRAACLLADAAWQANPDFRADRAVELALHGNWVGVDAAGRVIMAQALSSNFGRDRLPAGSLAQLCSEGDLAQARKWGLAMRLAQRLCGGVGSVLKSSKLGIDARSVRLDVRRDQQALIGEPVKRRLARLAEALGRTPEVGVWT